MPGEMVKNALMHMRLWDVFRKNPSDSTQTHSGTLTEQQMRQINNIMNHLGVVAPAWHQGAQHTWDPTMAGAPNMGPSVIQNPCWKNLLELCWFQWHWLYQAFDTEMELFTAEIEQELDNALQGKQGWDLKQELRQLGQSGVHDFRQMQVHELVQDINKECYITSSKKGATQYCVYFKTNLGGQKVMGDVERLRLCF